MTDNTKEILAEIERLREDLKQLREVVNVLVNVVMEDDELEDEEQELPPYSNTENKFNMYN